MADQATDLPDGQITIPGGAAHRGLIGHGTITDLSPLSEGQSGLHVLGASISEFDCRLNRYKKARAMPGLNLPK